MMTVRDMINKLMTYPPDVAVLVIDGEGYRAFKGIDVQLGVMTDDLAGSEVFIEDNDTTCFDSLVAIRGV